MEDQETVLDRIDQLLDEITAATTVEEVERLREKLDQAIDELGPS